MKRRGIVQDANECRAVACKVVIPVGQPSAQDEHRTSMNKAGANSS